MLPRFKDIDSETSEVIKNLLPSSATEFVRIIGLEATLSLVNEYGGCEIRLPRQPGNHETSKFEELSEIIGQENLIRLGKEFIASEQLYIPRCFRAMCALRNRIIINEYSEMIRTSTCRKAASDLARRYRTSQRSIEKIVNGKDVPSRAK